MARQVNQCPVCDSPLRITELTCVQCETKLHGAFPPAPLARLSTDHQRFLETFIRCRGVIRDVERALGISYPTVRARLDAAVVALEEALEEDRRHVETPPTESDPYRDARRREVLRQVAMGALDPTDAAEALRLL